jgi:hypothetical protein
MDNEEPGMKYTFEWLINKFNPPGWENWQERYNREEFTHIR